MTLVVSICRGRGSGAWALMSGDSATFVRFQPEDSGDEGIPTGIALSGKAKALTSRVLVCSTTDVAIGYEFTTALAERVRADDGLEACARAARTVIADLWDRDPELANRLYSSCGRTWQRNSIRRVNAFCFALTGFLDSGGVGLVDYRSGRREVGEILSHPEAPTLTMSIPFGVDPEDVNVFYGIDGSAIRTLADGFRFAVSVHERLAANYPERVSRDAQFVTLERRGGNLVADEFALKDCRDLSEIALTFYRLSPPEVQAELRAMAEGEG